MALLSPLLVQAEREPLAVPLCGTAAGQRVVNFDAWEIETQLGDFMESGVEGHG